MKFYNLHSTLFILVPDVDYLVSPGASGSTFHSVYISTANAAAIKYQISASTFHSVYISTELFKQSTFHSVYISTGYNIYTIDECGNLHSTLFILVPQGAFTLDRKTGNLHSTLFILVPLSPMHLVRLLLYLHSTLFILVRLSPLLLQQMSFSIYIPLCLY